MMSGGVLVLHTGARDNYQVALALHEAGLLDVLVTNGYQGANSTLPDSALAKLSPIAGRLRSRNCAGLPPNKVVSALWPDVVSVAARNLGRTLHSRVFRWQERRLGLMAADVALRHKCAAVVSYNYCAYHLFRALEGSSVRRVLFQCHPHPLTARQTLELEQQRFPSSQTLLDEKEMSWGSRYLAQLVAEPRMADVIVAASQFTRDSLIDNGTPSERITVVPYGSDAPRLSSSKDDVNSRHRKSGPFKILFVGQMGHRKGLSYLIDACERLGMKDSVLDICGRGFALETNRSLPPWARIHRDLSDAELAAHYRSAHVFVLPSILEGFGLVILEAMHFGVPVITTTATGGPDVIRDGKNGFVVAPRDVNALAAALARFRDDRLLLDEASVAASVSASRFTWDRFRNGIVDVVRPSLQQVA